MKKLIIFILFSFFIVIFTQSMLKNENREIYCTKETLADNVKKEISFKGNTLKIKQKFCAIKQNNAKADTHSAYFPAYTQISNLYIPVEGSFIYKEYTDGSTSLDTHNCGLTLRPYGGMVFTSKETFLPFIGARMFYYGSFGSGLIACKEGIMFCADKRLDNFPFFKNTALLLGINKNTAAFGAAVFF